MPRKSLSQEHQDIRVQHLLDWSSKGFSVRKPKALRRTIQGQELQPQLAGLARRNQNLTVDGSFLPTAVPVQARVRSEELFSKQYIQIQDAAKLLNPDLSKIKLSSAADYIGTYYKWNGVVQPEYDMREPVAILDTEGYVKQTVARKLALSFRNGYEIVGDRQEDVEYIERRVSAMELVTGQSFDNFLKSILRLLYTTSNCFVQKLRQEESAPVKKKESGKEPIAGYAIIPPHTMLPLLKDGHIVKWRRIFDQGVPYIDLNPDDVHHYVLDRKSGHIFGTPRLVGVRDDIFALRRLEENIELLFINHLFPLFHVKIGTENAPCTYGENGESEIDMVRWQIENMPKEGVFVTDERVEVEAVGAQGKSLSYQDLIDHYKSRIFTALGMSALDMGEGDGANRSTADNISQNLKDSIKSDLDDFCSQIRLTIFREWFAEATYSTAQDACTRTKLSFHEIDLDNRIKEETHVMALFNSNLLTETEARKRLKYKPMEKAQRRETHFELQVLRLEREITKYKTDATLEINEAEVSNQKKLASTQMKLLAAQTDHSEAKADHHEQKLAAEAKHAPTIASAKVKVLNASAQKAKAMGRGRPRSATAKKTTQTQKAVANKMRPTNQHGSNLGPTRAKSSLEESFMSELYTGLVDSRQSMETEGILTPEAWRQESPRIVDTVLERWEQQIDDHSSGDSYTRQVRAGLTLLKSSIAETSDPELLSVILSTRDQEVNENADRVESSDPSDAQ